jgi:hypothetical protein
MASDDHLANEHTAANNYPTDQDVTECNEREVIGLMPQLCFAKRLSGPNTMQRHHHYSVCPARYGTRYTRMSSETLYQLERQTTPSVTPASLFSIPVGKSAKRPNHSPQIRTFISSSMQRPNSLCCDTSTTCQMSQQYKLRRMGFCGGHADMTAPRQPWRRTLTSCLSYRVSTILRSLARSQRSISELLPGLGCREAVRVWRKRFAANDLALRLSFAHMLSTGCDT